MPLKTFGHCQRKIAALLHAVADERRAFAVTGFREHLQRINDLRVQMSVWRGIAARLERETGVGL